MCSLLIVFFLQQTTTTNKSVQFEAAQQLQNVQFEVAQPPQPKNEAS